MSDRAKGRGYKSSRWTEHKYPLAFLEYAAAITFAMSAITLAISFTNARHTDETLQHIETLMQQEQQHELIRRTQESAGDSADYYRRSRDRR